jgi:A/G-specific adenine glycosylase
MLQQTQVKTVWPYWERWMAHLPHVQSLADASSERIHKLWEGLGYYNRVRNMQQAARQICDRHRGLFPQDAETLQTLPGIGRYTAGAICSIAFDQPVPILDGNVIRVLTRALGIGGNPRQREVNEKLWALAHALIVEADRRRGSNGRPCAAFSQAMMELGALVCVPRKPLCARCPLATLCVAFREGRVERLPELPPRPTVTPLHYYAFVAAHRGRYLVRQRPAAEVNARLWEFPNIQVNGRARPTVAARQLLGIKPRRVEHRLIIKHTITRYRITLEVFAVEGLDAAAIEDGRWLTASQLRRKALPSAHKKILTRLPLDNPGFMLAPIP